MAVVAFVVTEIMVVVFVVSEAVVVVTVVVFLCCSDCGGVC